MLARFYSWYVESSEVPEASSWYLLSIAVLIVRVDCVPRKRTVLCPNGDVIFAACASYHETLTQCNGISRVCPLLEAICAQDIANSMLVPGVEWQEEPSHSNFPNTRTSLYSSCCAPLGLEGVIPMFLYTSASVLTTY